MRKPHFHAGPLLTVLRAWHVLYWAAQHLQVREPPPSNCARPQQRELTLSILLEDELPLLLALVLTTPSVLSSLSCVAQCGAPLVSVPFAGASEPHKRRRSCLQTSTTVTRPEWRAWQPPLPNFAGCIGQGEALPGVHPCSSACFRLLGRLFASRCSVCCSRDAHDPVTRTRFFNPNVRSSNSSRTRFLLKVSRKKPAMLSTG